MPRSSDSPSTVNQHWPAPRLLPAAGLLFLLALLCYGRSLNYPLVFDTHQVIAENRAAHSINPLKQLAAGNTRPVANYSFVVNYALHGEKPLGYHVVNLLVHWLCGVLLFFIVREAFSAERSPGAIRNSSVWLALIVAAIWLAHPLQTSCISHVVQRIEALMALFFLLTVACFLQADKSSSPWRWYAASVVFCAIGMGCKEVMVTAPAVVLACDLVLRSRTWLEPLTRRWGYYLALASTWGILAWLLGRAAPALQQEGVVGQVTGVTPWQYLLTQAGVLVHYLRLSVFPAPLLLDYSWPFAASIGDVWLSGSVILGLLGVTIWLFIRRNLLGLAGVWFFVILSPTSSFVPIIDCIFEHRMYLPLAAVLAVLVAGGYLLGMRVLSSLPAGIAQQRLAVLAGIWLAAVTVGTIVRNDDFASEERIWADCVAKDPWNERALYNYASLLMHAGKRDEALPYLQVAVQTQPLRAEHHFRLANALYEMKRYQEAEPAYLQAVRLEPRNALFWNGLGSVLMAQQRFSDAANCFERALVANPREALTYYNQGACEMKRQGDMQIARQKFTEAIRLAPNFTAAKEALKRAEKRLEQPQP